MPAEIIEQQPGGFARVRYPDGTEAWMEPTQAQQAVDDSYAQTQPTSADSLPAFGAMPDESQLVGPSLGQVAIPEGSDPAPDAAPPQDSYFAEEQAGVPQLSQPPATPVQPATPASQSGALRTSVPASSLRPMRRVQMAPTPPDYSQIEQGAVDTAQTQARAAEFQRDADLGIAGAQQVYQQQLAREEQAAAERHARLSAQAEQDTIRYQQEIDDALNRVPTMQPKRVWNNAGAFGSAMGVFSAAVGGWLQVMHGGPNYAMEQISKLIDQDIQAQQVDIETAREGVFRKERAYDRHQEDVRTKFQRLEEQRMFRWRSLGAALEAEVAKYASPIAQSNFLKQIAQANDNVMKTRGNILQQKYENSMAQYQAYEAARHHAEMERQGSIGLGIQSRESKARIKAMKAAAAPPYLPGATGVRTNNQPGWVAPNEKIREEAAGKFSAANTSYQGLGIAKKLATDRLGSPGSEERTRFVAANNRNIIEVMKQVEGLAGKGDWERLAATFGGDMDKFFRFASKDTVIKVLQDAQDSVERGMDSYTRGLPRDESTRVTWEAPQIPEDAVPEYTFGDAFKQVKASVAPAGNGSGVTVIRPERLGDFMQGTEAILQELRMYPDVAFTPHGKKYLEDVLSVLSAIPEGQRTVGMNQVDPVLEISAALGGETEQAAEAQTAEGLGGGIDWTKPRGKLGGSGVFPE